jgi:hypothetical protein
LRSFIMTSLTRLAGRVLASALLVSVAASRALAAGHGGGGGGHGGFGGHAGFAGVRGGYGFRGGYGYRGGFYPGFVAIGVGACGYPAYGYPYGYCGYGAPYGYAVPYAYPPLPPYVTPPAYGAPY